MTHEIVRGLISCFHVFQHACTANLIIASLPVLYLQYLLISTTLIKKVIGCTLIQVSLFYILKLTHQTFCSSTPAVNILRIKVTIHVEHTLQNDEYERSAGIFHQRDYCGAQGGICGNVRV